MTLSKEALVYLIGETRQSINFYSKEVEKQQQEVAKFHSTETSKAILEIYNRKLAMYCEIFDFLIRYAKDNDIPLPLKTISPAFVGAFYTEAENE